MSNFTRTHKIVILIIAIVITLGFGYKTVVDDTSEIEINDDNLFLEKDIEIENKSKDESDDLNTGEEQPLHSSENTPKQVVVHITGEVARPGIVTLEAGGRVIDAIKKAGGLTSQADEKSINLAQKLFDEDKIMIPNIDELVELDPSQASENEPAVIANTSPVVTSKNSGESSGSSGAKDSENSSGQININTASMEQLKTLSGIGDVTAQKIIDHRESTPFGTIDDIKNVSGIGDKKFDAIKNMITTR